MVIKVQIGKMKLALVAFYLKFEAGGKFSLYI